MATLTGSHKSLGYERNLWSKAPSVRGREGGGTSVYISYMGNVARNEVWFLNFSVLK